MFPWVLGLAPVHLPGFFYLHLLLRKPKSITGWELYRKISVLIPCRNEADVICDTIQDIVNATRDLYREIIVIDDGSTDNTFEIASNFTRFLARVKVFRKERGGNGKAEALNYGVERSTGDVVIVFDADSRPERVAIEKLLPYLSRNVIGVCGIVKVKNRDENWLTRLTSLEFSIANYIQYKKAFSEYYSPLFTGTLMALNKRYAIFPKSLVEDALLSMQLVRDGKEIAIEPSSVCTQIEPSSIRTYFRQRTRWAKGNWDLLRFWGKGKKFPNNLLILSEQIQPAFTLGSWALLAYSLGLGYGYIGMLSLPTIILTTLFVFFLFTLGVLLYKAVKFSGEKYPLSTYVLYFTVYQFLYLVIWLRALFPVRNWDKTPHNNSVKLNVKKHEFGKTTRSLAHKLLLLW